MERPEILEIVDVNKFNPYHDAKGRFASADGYASFTYAPGKSKAHDMAIARQKERQAAAGGTTIDGKDISDKLPEPINYDSLDLPELQGTEKQKKWAEEIRENALYHINNTIVRLRDNTAPVGSDFIEAASSKEGMAEYIKNHPLVQSTEGAIRQQKIDNLCGDFTTYAERYRAGMGILAHTDAKYWIDNRPNQLENHNYKKFYDIINGKTSTGSSSKAPGTPAGTSSGKLVVGNTFPSDLTGITRVSGNTYAHRDKLKAAGFKWNADTKEWVKKSDVILVEDETDVVYIEEVKE